MSFLHHVLRRNQRQPDYEIVTQLAIDEVRGRLSGKDQPGRLSDQFSRPLGLDGLIGRTFLTVELDRARLSGSIECFDGGAKISIWQRAHRGWWRDSTLVSLGTAVAMGLILRAIFGFDLSALGFVLLIFGLMQVQTWRRHRESRNSWIAPDDAVQIIANLVLASEAHKLVDDVPVLLPLATRRPQEI